MKLLLDTHILVWLLENSNLEDSERIADRVHTAVSDKHCRSFPPLDA
jgi:PIN domain nuclease of toxin-antitoxin system